MSLKKRTDLVQQESGRALCHCFAGRFDSAAFCAFGGRGRRFGRRRHPLPAGGDGRRQRQPSAFRLSSADRSAAIRHRRQRPGVLAEFRQCGGRTVAQNAVAVGIAVGGFAGLRRSGPGRQPAGPLRIQRQRRPAARHRPRRQRQTQLRL